MEEKDGMKKNQYEITMSHNQMSIINYALELLVRIGIGQFDQVGDVIIRLHKLFDKTSYWELRDNYFDPLKEKLLGFSMGASYGIGSDKVSPDVGVAYDMMKTIQKMIATEEKHNSMSVWHYGNILHMGSEKFIKINKIEDQHKKSKE